MAVAFLRNLLARPSRSSADAASESAVTAESDMEAVRQDASTLRAELLAQVQALSSATLHADAYGLIQSILTQAQDDGELLYARASVLANWGRLREALAGYLDAERCGLAHPMLYSQLAAAFSQTGNPLLAEARARRAIAIDPSLWNAHFVLGVALQGQGRHAEAGASFEHALTLRPDDVDCNINRGNCHLSLGQPAQAETWFRRALDLDSARAIAWTDLGVALDAQDDRRGAMAALEHAASLGVASAAGAECAFNLALAMMQDGRVEEALELYEMTLQRFPAPRGHCEYGEALLAAGRLRQGLAHYEFRWLTEPLLSLRPRVRRPRWSGQDLRGKTILLIAEQGVGDTIQFCRFAAQVRALGARVLFRVPDSLANLVETVPGVDSVSLDSDPIPNFDYHIPLVSLPHALGADRASIPNEVPYLHAPSDRMQNWAQRLAATDSIRVGLAWAGNPKHPRDRYRSIPSDLLARLGSLDGVHYYSLQKSVPGAVAAALPSELAAIDLGTELVDFADTAAAISQLDLVICVDTAVAHIAGALGKAVWLLLPDPADWRWMRNRSDSPWYPSMRLFRQRERGEWAAVLEDVRHALEDQVRNGQSGIGTHGETAARASAPLASESAAPIAIDDVTGMRRGHSAVAEVAEGMLQYFPDEFPAGLSIRLYGEHLRPQLDFLCRFIQPGAVIVEAGAGIGMHALSLSRTVGDDGHLILYESRPKLQMALRQNIGANGLKNITIMNRTLGHTGRPSSEIPIVGPDSGESATPPRMDDATESVDDLQLTRLDWLKVGTGVDPAPILEGAADAIWRLRPLLFIAISDEAKIPSVTGRIKEFGYRCWRMETPLFNPENFNRRNDDISVPRLVSIAIVAIPEEVLLTVALDGCVEVT